MYIYIYICTYIYIYKYMYRTYNIYFQLFSSAHLGLRPSHRPWALACCLASQASVSFSCTARWSAEARSSGCRALLRGPQTMGKPWENHGKTIGKPQDGWFTWENPTENMDDDWVFFPLFSWKPHTHVEIPD